MTSFKSAVKQVIYLLKLLREDMFLYFLFWFCFYLQCEDEVATVIVYLHGVFFIVVVSHPSDSEAKAADGLYERKREKCKQKNE